MEKNWPQKHLRPYQIESESMEETFAPVPTFDPHLVTELIRQRRSIFPQQYSGKPVSREEVELMLENANWAPTHGRTEPWRFIVFSGKGLNSLAEQHAELYKAEMPPEQFKEQKYEKLQIRATQAEYVIAICVEVIPDGKIPEVEEIAATACAVQNMHLTATALGIAGYWSSGGMTYHPGMKDILGLRESEKCLGFFYLGKFDGPWPTGKRRTNGLDKVKWVSE